MLIYNINDNGIRFRFNGKKYKTPCTVNVSSNAQAKEFSKVIAKYKLRSVTVSRSKSESPPSEMNSININLNLG